MRDPDRFFLFLATASAPMALIELEMGPAKSARSAIVFLKSPSSLPLSSFAALTIIKQRAVGIVCPAGGGPHSLSQRGQCSYTQHNTR